MRIEVCAVRKELLLDECQNVRDHEGPAKLAAVVHGEQIRQEERASGGDLAPRVGIALVRRDEKGVLGTRGLQRYLLRIRLGAVKIIGRQVVAAKVHVDEDGAARLQALLYALGVRFGIHFRRPPQPYDYFFFQYRSR